MNSVILIPCRLESTRFPNKPLALILGKPMIQWVYEAAEKSDATEVFVITDSEQIVKMVKKLFNNHGRNLKMVLNVAKKLWKFWPLMEQNTTL